ncbi:arginase family protein [Pseudooceanicola sp. CBS1P-1]|uniref:Arginase family protein n=1 Tax=Pseudooceanicola albus TaxID=2692189 RepID=A0A6L7G1W0_9RHOB|nr:MULTISPECIES: arginase family protein [Pseudooceanicola]MBT9383572.1 arginase family protein [Pseudooceanicola endophyticus]MXN17427.1 arginase family protein [Pseudooceanicola albus]
MPILPQDTLRLVMPQWQGGDEPAYRTGALILDAMLPQTAGPREVIEVPLDGERAPVDGIKSRAALLTQLQAAEAAIRSHDPAAILTVGGDCLVDLAPIAYLNERYDDLAVIWVDAHPDIMNKSQFSHAHAHVLAMLMGDGDADFTAAVKKPVDPARVLYVGVNDLMAQESAYLKDRDMTVIGPEALAGGPAPVLEWLKASGARHVAVHFDVDVLDPALRDDLLFNRPDVPADAFEGVATGKLELSQVIEILGAVAGETDVVGLAIAEYLPWKLISLSRSLSALPLVGTAQ